MHTGPDWKQKQAVKQGQIRQKFLLTVGGGKMLVGLGEISLTLNSKANGLNEAIPLQIGMLHIFVLSYRLSIWHISSVERFVKILTRNL